MNKIIYTICSANHLSYAKTMIDSFLTFNQEYKAIIGLADKINNRFETEYFNKATIIEVHELCIEGFQEMSTNYSILELNCALKPFFAKYIFNKYSPDYLLYIDSDICFFNSLQSIEDKLNEYDILLTPHFFQPLPFDELLPFERSILISGVYNAGFIAMKSSINVTNFLDWWCQHLKVECYYNFADGMGVDQLWLNNVPLFFNKVGILQNIGLNVAYWNLHERSITLRNNSYLVNDSMPLIFYHASGFNIKSPSNISKHQTRFNLNDLPILKQLLFNYCLLVNQNKYDFFSNIECFYSKKRKKKFGLMRLVNSILSLISLKIIRIN